MPGRNGPWLFSEDTVGKCEAERFALADEN